MATSGAYWRKSPITAVTDAVTIGLKGETKKAVTKVAEAVIKFSPVDSGAYRASWRVSVNKPIYYFIGRQRHLAGKGNPLAPPTLIIPEAGPFDKYYISNGAPYAYRIEQGWSGQSPMGAARMAVMKGKI